MTGKINRILFQGDSITDAGRSRDANLPPNAGLGGGFPGMIAAMLLSRYPARGYQIINRGISGNRVVDLYARWKADALNLSPDLISILIGVNDTWHEFGGKNGVEVDRWFRRSGRFSGGAPHGRRRRIRCALSSPSPPAAPRMWWRACWGNGFSSASASRWWWRTAPARAAISAWRMPRIPSPTVIRW